MAPAKLISIITPVFNRREELARCLHSLTLQSYSHFEALVVDDFSTIAIRDVVDGFADARFVYLRNDHNGGPYNARTVGWARARGEYVVNVDSDWEPFPWLLERVAHFFEREPKADAVTGMFMRNSDSRMAARVRGGMRLVPPEQVSQLPVLPDCIGGVRKNVVDEWLRRKREYFALESHAWLTFALSHTQLYVDEPWALYHTDSPNRVSPLLASRSSRRVDDCLLFLDDYDVVLRTVRRPEVDRMLLAVTRILLAHRHWAGLQRCAEYMRVREMPVGETFGRVAVEAAVGKARRLLGRASDEEAVTWI